MQNKIKTMRILLSRTDNIGDVILTLPMAGLIKEKYPKAEIYFLGKTYTKDIVACSHFIDKFLDWTEIEKRTKNEQVAFFAKQNIDFFIHVFPNKKIAQIAKKAKIKKRIGTSHRIYHHFYCNNLVDFSRKKSDLHEAQLNVKLLKPLSIFFEKEYTYLNDYVGFSKIPNLPEKFQKLLSKDNKNVILHSKSNGSGEEWGLENFRKLSELLLDTEKVKIFLTGTEKEGKLFRKKLLFEHKNLIDLSGQMTLNELIAFIKKADVLVASSTGPLHIAGVCGIQTLGLFPTKRPIHPGRWAALGKNVEIFTTDVVKEQKKEMKVCNIPPEIIGNKILN